MTIEFWPQGAIDPVRRSVDCLHVCTALIQPEDAQAGAHLIFSGWKCRGVRFALVRHGCNQLAQIVLFNDRYEIQQNDRADKSVNLSYMEIQSG